MGKKMERVIQFRAVQSLSCVQLLVTPWTVQPARLLSVLGIYQAKIWEWVPFPSPGIPHPGIEPQFPALQPGSLLSE